MKRGVGKGGGGGGRADLGRAWRGSRLGCLLCLG